MATANLHLPDGTKVTIEGSVDEVAALLERFSGSPSPAKKQDRSSGKKSPTRLNQNQRVRRKGPQPLIEELAGEGYFKSKRSIGEIQKKLEEKGHIYAQYSLSTPLLRLTRGKTLRRIKEKDGWVYVS